IPLEKKLAVELVVVIHLSPKDILLFPSRVSSSVWPKSRSNIRIAGALEWDIGHRVMVYNRLQVVFRQVCFLGADFLHHEASAGRLDERLEILSVVRVTLRNFNRRDDV